MIKVDNWKIVYDLSPMLYLFLQQKYSNKKLSLEYINIPYTGKIIPVERGVYYFQDERNFNCDFYFNEKHVYKSGLYIGDAVYNKAKNGDKDVSVIKITII